MGTSMVCPVASLKRGALYVPAGTKLNENSGQIRLELNGVSYRHIVSMESGLTMILTLPAPGVAAKNEKHGSGCLVSQMKKDHG